MWWCGSACVLPCEQNKCTLVCSPIWISLVLPNLWAITLPSAATSRAATSLAWSWGSSHSSQTSDVWARARLADVWLCQWSAYGNYFLFSCSFSVQLVFISEQNAVAVPQHFNAAMDIETLDAAIGELPFCFFYKEPSRLVAYIQTIIFSCIDFVAILFILFICICTLYTFSSKTCTYIILSPRIIISWIGEFNIFF